MPQENTLVRIGCFKNNPDGYIQLSLLVRKMTFQFRKLGVYFLSNSWKDTLMKEKMCFIYNKINRTCNNSLTQTLHF